MQYHGTKQVGIPELTVAVATATDPLDIVNAFMRSPTEVEMLPLDGYWTNRVCALAELIVAARPKPKRRRRKSRSR